MQRLRQRLPNGTPILVGLWPAEDAPLKDPKVNAEVGADHFTGSLEHAVSACARSAHTAAA